MILPAGDCSTITYGVPSVVLPTSVVNPKFLAAEITLLEVSAFLIAITMEVTLLADEIPSVVPVTLADRPEIAPLAE